jgi:glutathione synthase/RimK-type ligase-like ATP-grasp enzyme
VALATAASVWRTDTDADLTLDALHDAGVDARPAVWDDPAEDWAAYRLVVVRSTWDYVPRLAEFLAWADRVEAATELANPASVIRWNTDKSYLNDLAAAGVPVVATEFLRAGTDAEAHARAAVGAAVAASRDGHVVVKPTVSAGSKDTVRHGPEEAGRAVTHAVALLEAGRDVMVQPYLDAVDRDGETGMLFFGGDFSHAFRKGALLEPGGAPVDGLYAEEEIGPREASAADQAVARSALSAVTARLAATAGDLLYARVDIVPGADGSPVLLELELTEPSFFLATDPASAGRFARAVLDRAEASRG